MSAEYTYKFSAEDRLWFVYYPDGSFYGEYETEEEARAICTEPVIYICSTCGANQTMPGRTRPPAYCDECGADWKA